MSIFRPQHIRLVEQALLQGPENGSTGKQIWDAVDRAVPEHAVHLILGDMVSKGLAIVYHLHGYLSLSIL